MVNTAVAETAAELRSNKPRTPNISPVELELELKRVAVVVVEAAAPPIRNKLCSMWGSNGSAFRY